MEDDKLTRHFFGNLLFLFCSGLDFSEQGKIKVLLTLPKPRPRRVIGKEYEARRFKGDSDEYNKNKVCRKGRPATGISLREYAFARRWWASSPTLSLGMRTCN